jgi:hypothetical protein
MTAAHFSKEDSVITYQETQTGSVKVYLDKRYVGSIVKVGFSRGAEMWHYQPKGRHGTPPGASCYSIAAVKRTLEN